MKTKLLIVSTMILVLSSCDRNAKVESLKDDKEKASYAIGETFAKNLENIEQTMPVNESPSVDEYIDGMKAAISSMKGKSTSYSQGIMAGAQLQAYLNNIQASDKIDYNTVYAAIRATYSKDSLLVPEDSAGAIIQKYFQAEDEKFRNEQNDNRTARLNQAKEENAKKSQEFLNKNKSAAGVKTTTDGLQYKVNKEGTGPNPTSNDKVQVIYTGKLIDGTVFDSSQGQPVPMNVNGVVPGFAQGLQLMNKGANYTLYIPANLAYGENAPPSIGPNQALIFEVELVDFAPLTPEELKQIEDQNKQRMQMQQMQQMQGAQQAPRGN